jgi:hypothetical protein
MIPLFSINDELCPILREVCLNGFEEHVVQNRELLCFKYIHDFVIDVIFYVFRQAKVYVKKKAPVGNFLRPTSGEINIMPNI